LFTAITIGDGKSGVLACPAVILERRPVSAIASRTALRLCYRVWNRSAEDFPRHCTRRERIATVSREQIDFIFHNHSL